MRKWWIFLGVAFASAKTLAAGPDIVVESQPEDTRLAASKLFRDVSELLEDEDSLSVRLTRRFHQGDGWQFLVVVEGFTDASHAQSISERVEGFTVIAPASLSLATEAEAEVAVPDASGLVLAQEEGSAPVEEADERNEVVLPPSESDQPSTQEGEAPADGTVESDSPIRLVDQEFSLDRSGRIPDASNILRQAIRAHGGREGGNVVLSASPSILFSYERHVPDGDGGVVASNRFMRKDQAIRLEVAIQSGVGEDSITTLTQEPQGWVMVDGEYTERDPQRVLELLERFSPESVLAFPLGLPEDVETAEAWRGLQTVGKTSGDLGVVWVLEGQGGALGLQQAAFDLQDHTLRWVRWISESGEILFYYDDYREIGKGLVIPFITRVERSGRLVEEIRVTDLQLEVRLQDELFSTPIGG